jgi:putative glutamine amidotransferase
MIENALEAELPILGICRGAQLMNVVMGGSLHPDLRGIRVRTSNRRTVLPRKLVQVEPASRLFDALGAESCRVNSLHHQAADRIGAGLRAVATDLDGIVQGIENPTMDFQLGVQWHPEYLPYRSHQRRLFRTLVEAAGRRLSRS